jgi:hypothetical protein
MEAESSGDDTESSDDGDEEIRENEEEYYEEEEDDELDVNLVQVEGRQLRKVAIVEEYWNDELVREAEVSASDDDGEFDQDLIGSHCEPDPI